jgi:tRNA (cytidine/uridine-2'-O-)-methyltransferase
VTGTPLHLVAPLGFSLSEKKLRRAGLDYWDKVHAATHASFDEMVEDHAIEASRLHLFTARGQRTLWETTFRVGDWLVLGEEQKGLPEEVLGRYPERWVRVPMIPEPSARSLNLSTCAGIALYEALRQARYPVVQ